MKYHPTSFRIHPLACAAALFVLTPLLQAADIWRQENLVGWSIVAYDAKKRGPEARAAMLQRLDLQLFGYGFRKTDVRYFDAEVIEMQRHGVEMIAWLFPRTLDDSASKALQVIERHGIRPQIWITGGGEFTTTAEEQEMRLQQELDRIRPTVAAAARLRCTVGLYNHGGWFGEPENQMAMLQRLKGEGFDHVGLVYNFHHGHGHIDNFPAIWKQIHPYVLTLNINGMVKNGDKEGKKIMYLGEGDHELAMMRIVEASGWQGRVGILGHRTDEDAEVALSRNLEGLRKLVRQLREIPAKTQTP